MSLPSAYVNYRDHIRFAFQAEEGDEEVGPGGTVSTPSLGTPLVGRENVNVIIGDVTQPIEFTIDSGADINIMKTDSANLINFDMSSPARHETITTVSGTSTQIPIFNVQFEIEGQSAINVELGVHPQSPYNLITIEAIGQVFTAVVNPAGGFDLSPIGQTPAAPAPQTPTAPTTTTPQPTSTIAKSGNPIIDAVRELYRVFCAVTPPIPFICSSPNTFAMALIILILVLLILIVRGN